MNLGGVLLLGYLLVSGPTVGEVEQAMSLGAREFLGLPADCGIVTTLHLESRGSLITGMVVRAEVDLYDVDLERLRWPTGVGAPSTGNLRGRIERLDASFHRAIAGGFGIERLTFLVEGVDFNLGKLMVGGGLALTRAGPCRAEIVIDPQEVAKYIDARSQTLKDVELTLLEEGEVNLSARMEAPLLSPSVEVRGRLEIVEGEGVEMTDASLRFGGLPLPGLATRRIMQEINPILGLEQGSFLASIFLPRSLEFQGGKIVLRGEGTTPFLPPAVAE